MHNENREEEEETCTFPAESAVNLAGQCVNRHIRQIPSTPRLSVWLSLMQATYVASCGSAGLTFCSHEETTICMKELMLKANGKYLMLRNFIFFSIVRFILNLSGTLVTRYNSFFYDKDKNN